MSDAPMAGRELGITDREFEAFRELVHRSTGIHLGPQKRHLLVARLGRRLRALGLPSFSAYLRYLAEEDTEGAEIERLVNAVTTNKTDFFREAHHFRYLAEHWLPELRARAARGGERRVRLWSAGCSTGEEPYTLALTLLEGLGTGLGWDVRILASDIDTECLARAAAGVYTLEQVRPVPPALLHRYFLRGRGADAGCVQVRPEVRALVTFRRINFVDDPWPIRTRFDAIFCRNVLIYFDRATQQRILERLLGYLAPDGLLCLGHSEGVHGLAQGLVAVGHTMYRRAGARAPALPVAPGPAR